TVRPQFLQPFPITGTFFVRAVNRIGFEIELAAALKKQDRPASYSRSPRVPIQLTRQFVLISRAVVLHDTINDALCRWLPEHASGRTKSCRLSAPVEWARYTRLTIRSSTVTSR